MALSPRRLWGFRRLLLRSFGAKVGRDVHIFPNVKIAIPWNLILGDHAAIGDKAILYSLGRIEVGARSTVSQYAHLCAGSHNHRSTGFELLKLPIHIGEDAWICADAFIGPNTIIGDRAVVAARAVVAKNVASDTIVGGNPAKKIGVRVIDNQR